MKIGIDARLYGTGHGGIGRYIKNLVYYLEQIDKKNEYLIFLHPDDWQLYHPSSDNFKKIKTNCRVYSLKEQLWLPWYLARYNLDLIHFPHFNVPWLYRKGFVVTIHDLIISHFPDSRASTLPQWLYKIKLFFYFKVIKSTARRARSIITVSNYTKNDIIHVLRAPSEKIKVIYEGVDQGLSVGADCDKILAKLKINADFLLYVGSAYPHKNLDSLLLAFKKLVNQGLEYYLVLVGKKDYFYKKIETKISKLGLADKVILPGYLSDTELSCLYRRARLYVFPSLLEGFGLPPLEAQSHGLPIASSKFSCLPEILADGAAYFDPQNIEDMVECLSRVLSDESLRQNLKSQATQNLTRFSWINAAKETKQIYLGR